MHGTLFSLLTSAIAECRHEFQRLDLPTLTKLFYTKTMIKYAKGKCSTSRVRNRFHVVPFCLKQSEGKSNWSTKMATSAEESLKRQIQTRMPCTRAKNDQVAATSCGQQRLINIVYHDWTALFKQQPLEGKSNYKTIKLTLNGSSYPVFSCKHGNPFFISIIC